MDASNLVTPRSAVAGIAGSRRVKDRSLTLLAPALLVLLVLFIVPVSMLLVRSLTDPTPGLQNYIELARSSSYRTIFANTFMVAAIVAVVSLILGFPLAWLLTILPKGWSQLLFGIVILSMWTNLLTRTFAWLVLLQTTGVVNRLLKFIGLIDHPLPLVNNLVGVTIGMTYIMLPFIVLPLQATMAALDPITFRAASICGATKWQVFYRIFLPSCMPGIMSGVLMVFVMALGYYITPALLGGTSNMMISELIAQLIQSLLDWGLGSAAAFMLLLVTLALYAIQLRLFDPLKHVGGGR